MEKHNIATDASYVDDRTHVLNHRDTFGIMNRSGDILPLGKEVHGIYHKDTRFVNQLRLRINQQLPVLLSSNIKEANEILSVDLTNPGHPLPDGRQMEQGSIHIHRSQLVRNGNFHEKIELKNYQNETLPINLSLHFDGDFKDIFEIRGTRRDHRGSDRGHERIDDHTVVFSNQGLDGAIRKCKIVFNQPFSDFQTPGKVCFDLPLAPKELKCIEYSCHFTVDEVDPSKENYWDSRSANANDLGRSNDYFPDIRTANEHFTHWIHRSKADLVSLMADTPTGKYPYAGVPWYNTAFGRDGIITALQTLWVAPRLSKDVLLFLADQQATSLNESIDAEPGKILHEIRGGEMAAMAELPFKKYYGTVDATPLFVMLAGEYHKRTGDLKTIKRIWKPIEKALDWIDRYGDIDQDGYVEYQAKSKNGLTNQGWKDSHDSIFHANGQLAGGSIALCEVQGYVYSAKRHGARLAKLFGYDEKSARWEADAIRLKERFNRDFWDDTLNSYVLALDGNKEACKVKSSNAGQVLFTGIADPEKADKLVKTLLQPDMFSGWGLRTLSSDEIRYNPMSYHNGSVWPHDVALVADGMGKYGYQEQALRLMTGLFDASLFTPLQRMPELFCGFGKRTGEGPTAYPVACSPQAWSVAAVFLLLKSILQIDIDHGKKELCFFKPILPEYLRRIRIKDMELGGKKVDIEVIRHDKNNMVGVNWNLDDPNWRLKIIK
ncbi:amylo-alpha-1,6-glucosidase [Pseudozobellia thermophila]|uniref:Glycogen debranching enzyme (Alpha-1,6-glucosidase) n=1 Tax=Pseudozobellia thermophila TaxID=192903 RepID=A0A1M6G7B5_9FLAO|nr:amylo-alpha-1,6-glucosidase [Pseudozobellia thermophila]SHJ05707.1 Glycogen debranching enzyme (alpha-1,6-glucosidase) [Pseudozobellia thermophila]